MYRPAHKRLAALTSIEASRSKIDDLRSYFWSSKPPEILPPLFDQYVIRVTYAPEDASKIMTPEEASKIMERMGHIPTMTQEIYVCHDTPTEVYLLSYIDGKKQIEVSFDYNLTTSDEQGRLALRYNTESLIPESAWENTEELLQAASDVINIYRYVTFYLLYYRPDVEYTDPPPRRKQTGSRSRSQKPEHVFVLRSKVRRYQIEERERPAQRTYSKFTWAVRGHFRRAQSGKLVYINPHMARRRGASDKKPAPSKYKIK